MSLPSYISSYDGYDVTAVNLLGHDHDEALAEALDTLKEESST